jgi:hypothetical protein
LCDLSSYTDEQLQAGAMTTLALLLLKHVRDGDLGVRLPSIFRLLLGLNEQTALQFLETILRYLGAFAHTVTGDVFRRAIECTFTETGGINMDRLTEELIAGRKEELLRQGLEAGMQKGRMEGRMEERTSFTIRLLLRKFRSLDTDLEDRVRRLSQEELEALGDDLLDIPNEAALTEWLDRRSKSH